MNTLRKEIRRIIREEMSRSRVTVENKKMDTRDGIDLLVGKTTKGGVLYHGVVRRGDLIKFIPSAAYDTLEGVKQRALQIWDMFGQQLVRGKSLPNIKSVKKFEQMQGIQVVSEKTTNGNVLHGGYVTRGKYTKFIPMGTYNNRDGVIQHGLQIWKEFGKKIANDTVVPDIKVVNH